MEVLIYLKDVKDLINYNYNWDGTGKYFGFIALKNFEPLFSINYVVRQSICIEINFNTNRNMLFESIKLTQDANKCNKVATWDYCQVPYLRVAKITMNYDYRATFNRIMANKKKHRSGHYLNFESMQATIPNGTLTSSQTTQTPTSYTYILISLIPENTWNHPHTFCNYDIDLANKKIKTYTLKYNNPRSNKSLVRTVHKQDMYEMTNENNSLRYRSFLGWIHKKFALQDEVNYLDSPLTFPRTFKEFSEANVYPIIINISESKLYSGEYDSSARAQTGMSIDITLTEEIGGNVVFVVRGAYIVEYSSVQPGTSPATKLVNSIVQGGIPNYQIRAGS